MTRAPLPALRRLFAVGGAPAASHVVLSRAPSSDRLLAPMARSRIANETSLNSLVRPLDVGRVLSRVTEAAAARVSSTEAEGPEAVRRRGPPAKTPAAGPSVTPAAVEAAATPRSPARPRSVARPPVDAAAVRAAVARAFDEPAVARARIATPPVSESPREPPFVRREATPSPSAQSSAPVSDVRRQPRRSPAAQAGAESRVVVGSGVADIDRLLAVAERSARAPLTPETSVRRRATPRERDVEPQDASRLLASVVERVESAVAVPSSPPAHVAARLPISPVAEAPQRIRTQVAAPDIESSTGGFRGLAQRTLASNNGRSAPVRRIEPERLSSMDLTLDALDSRVADSLARVLEREARRHGIDLAEARA